MKSKANKNPYLEAEQFRRRAVLGFAVTFLCLTILMVWYFKLQVLDNAEYTTRSESNRIKGRPIVPARGMIYDRNGVLLAENVPAFRLDVTLNKTKNIQDMLKGLAPLIHLSEEDQERFLQASKHTSRYRPITLKARISSEEMANFAVEQWRYPGVELVPYFTRYYPYGELFAHIVGYVGRIDEKDIKQLGEGYAALTHIGKTGLERYYDEALRGKVGYDQVEVTADGRVLRTIGRIPARAGSDLRLSVDIELQKAMVEAFGEYEGSAVAVDPRNGEVLAMVSLPSYDSNLFVNGISNTDFKMLNDNPSRPQFNRLVLGGVAPGSTLKPLIALAGLDSGTRRPEDITMSTGMFYLPGQRGRGWGDASSRGHGATDVKKSIYASVNTYYYRLSLDMGIDKLDQYLKKYGFGEPTGIDLMGEISGVLPTPAWKLKTQKSAWYAGDTVNTSIGQGYWVVTPLQLARGTAALADDGRLRRLHLVREQRDAFDQPWQLLPQPEPRLISTNTKNLGVIRDGMIATVHGPGGTARAIGVGSPYKMAGKTGTAQVVSRRGDARVNPRELPMHRRHRALFMGYAPADNPTIALMVSVEGGGYGGSTAAPIARKIFDAYLLKNYQMTSDPHQVIEDETVDPEDTDVIPTDALRDSETNRETQP